MHNTLIWIFYPFLWYIRLCFNDVFFQLSGGWNRSKTLVGGGGERVILGHLHIFVDIIIKFNGVFETNMKVSWKIGNFLPISIDAACWTGVMFSDYFRIVATFRSGTFRVKRDVIYNLDNKTKTKCKTRLHKSRSSRDELEFDSSNFV